MEQDNDSSKIRLTSKNYMTNVNFFILKLNIYISSDWHTQGRQSEKQTVITKNTCQFIDKFWRKIAKKVNRKNRFSQNWKNNLIVMMNNGIAKFLVVSRTLWDKIERTHKHFYIDKYCRTEVINTCKEFVFSVIEKVMFVSQSSGASCELE